MCCLVPKEFNYNFLHYYSRTLLFMVLYCARFRRPVLERNEWGDSQLTDLF